MKELNELDTLNIDFSKITPIQDVSENILLSEELLEKYKIEIDESKIEQIIAEIPEERRQTLTFEDKIEYIRKNIESFKSVSKRSRPACYCP